MRKFIKNLAFLVLLGANAYAQGEMKVLTPALSVRETPNGRFVETVNGGTELPLLNLLDYWGRSQRGWVNCDFTDYALPPFKVTGHIELTVAKVVEPTQGLKEGDAVVVYRELQDSVIGLFKGEPVELGKEKVVVEKREFEVAVSNYPLILTDEKGNKVKVKGGTPLLRENSLYLYKGHLWSGAERLKEETALDREELLREINRLIDIFNSVKLSSPLSERLGYYVKTLPVKNRDLKIVKTPTGTGVLVDLRYQFVMKDGRIITGRKTRLFLKRSNFEFWRKLTEELFNRGVNKFVEIDVYRFNGEDGFEEEGFVASSYHLFKEKAPQNYETFVDCSESNLSEDLWFFADQVYERLEGEN